MLIITVYKLYYCKKNATREATYVIESSQCMQLFMADYSPFSCAC